MKKKRKELRSKKENIINIPNFLTLIRFVLTFVLIYMFFVNYSVKVIFITFVIAALTDFLDGQVARRFSQVTRFGAKFDIIADRFLWITTGILLLVFFPIRGIFDRYHLIQMILILTREILCFPYVIANLVQRKSIMIEARWSGKTTTFLQGFAIATLMLSTFIPFFRFSIILAVLCFISGIWAALDYVRDIRKKK